MLGCASLLLPEGTQSSVGQSPRLCYSFPPLPPLPCLLAGVQCSVQSPRHASSIVCSLTWESRRSHSKLLLSCSLLSVGNGSTILTQPPQGEDDEVLWVSEKSAEEQQNLWSKTIYTGQTKGRVNRGGVWGQLDLKEPSVPSLDSLTLITGLV